MLNFVLFVLTTAFGLAFVILMALSQHNMTMKVVAIACWGVAFVCAQTLAWRLYNSPEEPPDAPVS